MFIKIMMRIHEGNGSNVTRSTCDPRAEKVKCQISRKNPLHAYTLTDGIFETGVYAVPSKSQNSTVLGQGGPSSTQCSNPSWA